MARKKLYVIRKYILATSAKDAIKKERTQCVDDVWLEDRDLSNLYPKEAMGFAPTKK